MLAALRSQIIGQIIKYITLFTFSALLPTTTEQPQVCKCELMALQGEGKR